MSQSPDDDEPWLDDPDGVEFSDEEPVICYRCNGSGEGMFDGSTCPRCDGSGEITTGM